MISPLLFQVLLLLLGFTAAAVLAAYSLFAPWWTSRAGRAVFALYWTVGLLIAHFAAEEIWGQGAPWRELVLMILMELVLLWNGYVIVSKQVLARRNHEEGH
ncbi:hypothetical protein PV761_03175 [Arthrobacter sp. CC3]|uniref:putative phage holin n=1 Tax=Arthrobacter sp. CC3 TaxID=3029185 RepID=UPI0032660C84